MKDTYPIEQLATGTGGGLQIAFARKARDLLPKNDETCFEISNKGLLILGATEDALTRPREILRDTFGAGVRFAAPRVRLVYADGWQQPIMGFRVEAETAHLKEIEHGLKMRSAEISDVELQTRIGIIRGHAPLVGLIGYPRSLHRLSGGRAHAAFWLSHYDPLWSYTNETMACFSD